MQSTVDGRFVAGTTVFCSSRASAASHHYHMWCLPNLKRNTFRLPKHPTVALLLRGAGTSASFEPYRHFHLFTPHSLISLTSTRPDCFASSETYSNHQNCVCNISPYMRARRTYYLMGQKHVNACCARGQRVRMDLREINAKPGTPTTPYAYLTLHIIYA